MIVPRSLQTKGNKKNFLIGQIFYIFKITYEPFIFAKNSFSKIWSINSDRDDFLCWYWAKCELGELNSA